MRNIQPLIEAMAARIAAHKTDDRPAGTYARFLWQDDTGTRKLGNNEYGCADAANILYTIGRFPQDPAVRAHWVAALQDFQDPETGLFTENTHHTYHTTAHCIAALELFDARPKHPLTALHPYLTKDGLYDFLASIDWAENPWIASHLGAGIYAALVIPGEASPEWQQWYFDWLWEHTDPASGFWPAGVVRPILKADSFSGERTAPSVFPFLACGFHFYFNHSYARMPIRYPEAMVDTCLRIFRNHEWESLGQAISFAEIDWVYCLNRAMIQSGYKMKEAREALKDFADGYIDYLFSLDPETDDRFNDLHSLFGCVCALAELQQALPGYIHTDKPLKLVLERRPFI